MSSEEPSTQMIIDEAVRLGLLTKTVKGRPTLTKRFYKFLSNQPLYPQEYIDVNMMHAINNFTGSKFDMENDDDRERCWHLALMMVAHIDSMLKKNGHPGLPIYPRESEK